MNNSMYTTKLSFPGRLIFAVFGALLASPAFAVDSYRYLHVTIDTPWSIFLFLLPIVLSPFILMAFLYWRYAGRRRNQAQEQDEGTNQ